MGVMELHRPRAKCDIYDCLVSVLWISNWCEEWYHREVAWYLQSIFSFSRKQLNCYIVNYFNYNILNYTNNCAIFYTVGLSLTKSQIGRFIIVQHRIHRLAFQRKKTRIVS